LSMGQGQEDSTQIFEQYHPSPNSALQILAKYALEPSTSTATGKGAAAAKAQSPCDSSAPPTSVSSPPTSDPFHTDLLELLRRTGDTKASPLVFLLSLAGAVLVCWVWVQWAQGSLAALLVLPFLHWLAAVNIAHDANHFALSKHPWVNELMGFIGAPLFFNSGQWYHQHNVAHHQHTNVVGKDHDLHHFGVHSRLHVGVPWAPPHAMQVAFMAFAFPLATFVQCCIFPARLLGGWGFLNQPREEGKGEGEGAHHLVQRTRLATSLQLAWSWGVIAYPLWAWGLSWGSLAWGAYPYAMAGVVFMAVTQVSHIQEVAQSSSGSSGSSGSSSSGGGECKPLHWARHQVSTSVDYSQSSALVTFLTGALNMQSLHHCFPGVHSSRLRAMYPAFREVCGKHGVAINEVGSFWEALKGYGVHLARMSRKGQGGKGD
jgi:fatty acid desaturase